VTMSERGLSLFIDLDNVRFVLFFFLRNSDGQDAVFQLGVNVCCFDVGRNAKRSLERTRLDLLVHVVVGFDLLFACASSSQRQDAGARDFDLAFSK